MMRKRSFVRPVMMAILDCLFCWLSWIGSIFVFTYLFKVNDTLLNVINRYWWVIFIVCIAGFNFTGVYKSLWQHPGIGTMLRLLTSVFLCSFVIYVALRLELGYWSNPGLGMMAFYFLLTLSLGMRLLPRICRTVVYYAKRTLFPHRTGSEVNPIRTLLIGAGESASSFLLNVGGRGGRSRKVLGILDNDLKKHGYSLHGVRILGGDERLAEFYRQLEIEEIIVAVPSMSNETLSKIVHMVPVNKCKVRVLSNLSSGVASAPDRLRDISIEDLLGRPETELDEQSIERWVKGKTVLVTGGGGSIGSELCRQLLRFEPEKIVIFDISENNAHNLKERLTIEFGQKGRYRAAIRIGSIQDEARLNEVFAEFKPSIVFHAAAYKHVPLMEQCPRLALENNVLGTYRTGMCAIRHKVERFVMISTDKAVNPTNVMGASKRLAELLLLSLNEYDPTEFVCVRFGNVLDSNGSVVPLFKRQIEAGGPITVTHPEIIRYLMTIPEAARLVLEAGAMARGGEIFVLDMGKPVKIVDLAENMIRMAGLIPNVDIKIEYTGLRPGEKLYEELLLDEEGIGKTQNEKIFVVCPTPMTEERREEFLKQMDKTFNEEFDVYTLIKQFVPEYLSIDTVKEDEPPAESAEAQK